MISQGILNGQITKHANNPAKLKEIMADQPESVKVQARCHLAAVLALQAKGKK